MGEGGKGRREDGGGGATLRFGPEVNQTVHRERKGVGIGGREREREGGGGEMYV